MSTAIATSMVCEADSPMQQESRVAGEKLGPASESPCVVEPSQTSRETTTTAFESEDAMENMRLLSPPGLKGSRPWDDWDEEAPPSPLKEGMLGDDNTVLVPPGLGGVESADFQAGLQFEMPELPPWCSTMPEHLDIYSMAGSLSESDRPKSSLQVTSFPCEDWKAMFPPSFAGHSLNSKWESQEPAVILPSDTTAAEAMLISEDDLAYVKSDSLGEKDLTSADALMAENARLTMENEILKAKMMESFSYQSGDVSPPGFWAGDGNMHGMDMSWGMNPFFGNPWYSMMPMSYTGAPSSKKSSTRARTDSDLVTKPGDNGRARAMTDPDALGTVSEAFNTGEYTTVMLRNLPNNYSRAMLLKLIDAEGFSNQYDFIYLPMDFKSHASLGYAFVNLTTAELAQRFFETFEGFHRWVVPSQKVCSVNWSHPYQGLDAHIERYRNSPVMHEDVPDEYKPMVFKEGERYAFPPPTKKLKVPRMRPGHDKAAIEEVPEGADAEEVAAA